MTDDVADLALPLRALDDLNPLLDRVGDARIVMLGEASHGTHEYYRWRADATRRLVEEKGFSFVAVEGDWPDCFEVNRCVKHRAGAEVDPRRVLDGFARWPTWMWANDEVVDFTRWLRVHNGGRPEGDLVGFYGLDVYSLWDSMRELMGYLREHEPQHVEQAVAAYRCFEPYAEDPQSYARATRVAPTTCEPQVVELLSRLCAERDARVDGGDPEARFAAEQNAAVAAGAERYYRAMVRGGPDSWNVRDTHMADTLDRLLELHGPGSKAVVWEHNTHIGDARATRMAAAGMVNLGQLGRERHGAHDVVLVGFGGYRGGVVAGEYWGAPMQRMPVREAWPGSLERLLHDRVGRDALFVFDTPERRAPWLVETLPHRAIGVVYDPNHERYGNYVPTVLAERYDAFLYFDDTGPVRPLHLEPQTGGEAQTYPAGA